MAYIFTVFVGVGRPFMRLWSGLQSDIPYYTALLLMSPLLVTSIQSIGIEIQRAKDMHRFRSVLYFVIATFNIAVSIPLCVRFGEIGCALGTCVCIFVGNIIIMNIYYQRRVGLDMAYFWKQILRLAPSLVLPAAALIDRELPSSVAHSPQVFSAGIFLLIGNKKPASESQGARTSWIVC